MPTSQKTQKILALFQKALKSDDDTEINNIDIEDLKSAYMDISSLDRNSSVGQAIKTRIEDIKNQDTKQVLLKRHQQIVLLTLIAIFVAIIIA